AGALKDALDTRRPSGALQEAGIEVVRRIARAAFLPGGIIGAREFAARQPRPGGRRKARGGCLITESLLRGLRIQQVRNRLSFELRGVALDKKSAPDGIALHGKFAIAHSIAPAAS